MISRELRISVQIKVDRIGLVFWAVFCAIFALYQFGFAINIPWGSRSVPFSEVWASVDGRGAFRLHPSDDFFLTFLAGAGLGVALMFIHSDRNRAILLGVVSIVCMVQFEFVMAALMIIGPLLIFSELAGGLDGESYQEGMHQAGAAGLLVLCCFMLSLFFLIRFIRGKRGEVTQAAEVGEMG